MGSSCIGVVCGVSGFVSGFFCLFDTFLFLGVLRRIYYIILGFLRNLIMIFFRYRGLFHGAPPLFCLFSREKGWFFSCVLIGTNLISSIFCEYSGYCPRMG